MLSLQVLAMIEARLRDRLWNPRLVLADYFDHIAGTSTGAIIAAGLALGHSVEQVEERYRSLGSIVFRKRFLPLRARSLYVDRPLRRELGTFFGADRTLGDADLRTLLLIVMHNTVTDSPWLLSNCTRAKYNRADRNLLPSPDRNLDIPLAPLVRASTAAPIYFAPEELHVGRNRFLFQDGGVTPFNNPALLQFLMATLPEYGLRWETGEDRLRNPRLVLADYFDHIAGTSTGAIIAAGLALGHSVQQVEERYSSLGSIVFRKRFLPLRARSLYVDRPLRRELSSFFGADRTLGDADLRTLLLVVMHNTVTDSPWLLSNCTRAKYNRADRNLLPSPDRNLDIPLAPLIRASTAAPIYFAPEELHVGPHRFLFQDGALTSFNNPAFVQFLTATLPEYGLGWETGEDRLLIVSVGTGSSAATHPGLRRNRVNLPFNARNLPSVFMNGAAVSQDLLCRSFGFCRFGATIDREVGDLVEAPGIGGANLFSYVRYDADLSNAALEAFGVIDPKVGQRVRKLDAVDQLPLLRDLGNDTARHVDIDRHFDGFLT